MRLGKGCRRDFFASRVKLPEKSARLASPLPIPISSTTIRSSILLFFSLSEFHLLASVLYDYRIGSFFWLRIVSLVEYDQSHESGTINSRSLVCECAHHRLSGLPFACSHGISYCFESS